MDCNNQMQCVNVVWVRFMSNIFWHEKKHIKQHGTLLNKKHLRADKFKIITHFRNENK